jgi:hypothetical protein
VSHRCCWISICGTPMLMGTALKSAFEVAVVGERR